MKQSKRKKPVAAPVPALYAGMVVEQPQLPDAEYVEQLLADAPVEVAVEPAIEAVAESAAAQIEQAVDTSMNDVNAVVAVSDNSVSEHDAASETTALEATDDDVAVHQGVLMLPKQCLLRDASEYRQKFISHLDDESISIDVSEVERIDTAFMQVLVVFVRGRAATGRANICWLNVNEVFQEAAEILGLRSALTLSEMSMAA